MEKSTFPTLNAQCRHDNGIILYLVTVWNVVRHRMTTDMLV